MTTRALKNFITGLPSKPGIYRFKDSRKKDLYIGKATNLKNRVSSYLKTEDGRIVKMIESAQSLEFISTESEIEALILESQLIKQFRPPFNIMLRDDKQYFYVGFTYETFPKIFLTHQTLDTRYKIPNTKFIGPFTDGNTLKSTLRFLRRIFPYCTCKQLHNNFCLNYHIGKCLGYCCLKNKLKTANGTSLNSYNVFVRTHYKNLSQTSLPELKEYIKNIRAIKDILGGKRASLIKKLEKEMGQLAQKGELEKAIELRNKISDLKIIFENAMIIKNSEILKTHRSRLESLLKLQKPIIRIEGYDVSNIQGDHAAGSMVVFTNGKPNKNGYRKFKIRTNRTLQPHHDRSIVEIKNGGDTGMLKEILERRFKHEEWPFPDLILIDGGKGQVNAAVKTLKEMAIKIQIIGISKNEHHIGHQLIIPGRKNPLPLTKLSPADKNLLLAIDSEAHRFAIGYYRKLHIKLFR